MPKRENCPEKMSKYFSFFVFFFLLLLWGSTSPAHRDVFAAFLGSESYKLHIRN
jgi:hypothetical protein